jgi:ubiquinone/menaquinone biosynthesis C-methylase UbiE
MKHSDHVRKEYDKLAPTYDQRWSRYIDVTLRETLDSLHLEGDERVLDVPIGTGELASRLLEKWPQLRITGVDLSPQMLKQAAAKQSLSTVELHEACVTKLPFPDNEFDCVFCVNSFHYFSKPQSALGELRRVLRDGGRLVLVDWCDDYLACKLCSMWLRIVDPAFHRTYAKSECETLLTENSFQVVHSRTFRVDWIWGMMLFEVT